MSEVIFWDRDGRLELNFTIWKYLDLSKFLSLLETEKLFFSQPKHFEDPWEGEFSDKDFKSLTLTVTDTQRKELRSRFSLIRDRTAISCWHINNYESAAMWKLYLRNGEGIAIKSTIQKLGDALDAKPLSHDVHISDVKYIDYSNTHASSTFDDLEVFFCKRPSFSHENELRAVVQLYAPPKTGKHLDDMENLTKTPPPNGGIAIPVDLAKLVSEIYLAPKTPAWLETLVKDLMKRYGLGNIKVTQSPLYDLK